MHPDSIVDHDLGGQLSLAGFPSHRLYYYSRNAVYFWLHEYYAGDVWRFLSQPPSIARLLLKPVLMSGKGWTEIRACLRGIRDGLLKKTHRRF
jgi:hypothetical protein